MRILKAIVASVPLGALALASGGCGESTPQAGTVLKEDPAVLESQQKGADFLKSQPPAPPAK